MPSLEQRCWVHFSLVFFPASVPSQLFGLFTHLDVQSTWPSIFVINGSPFTSRIVSESDVAAALAALEGVRNDLATRREDAQRRGVPEVPSPWAIEPHNVCCSTR